MCPDRFLRLEGAAGCRRRGTCRVCPDGICSRSCANNPQEPLNQEIRSRAGLVGNFPDCTVLIRLVGAVLLAEQHDVRIEGRRYFSLDPTQESRTVGTASGATTDRQDGNSELALSA